MKKIIYIISTLFILTLIFSNIGTIQLGSSVLAAIFTVAGIVFSIGLSLIVSFNMSGIENPAFIKDIRFNLSQLMKRYMIYFGYSSFVYLLNEFLSATNTPCKIYDLYTIYGYEIRFNVGLLACLSLIFSIIYSVVNMIETQKLNHQIFDEVLNNKKEE